MKQVGRIFSNLERRSQSKVFRQAAIEESKITPPESAITSQLRARNTEVSKLWPQAFPGTLVPVFKKPSEIEWQYGTTTPLPEPREIEFQGQQVSRPLHGSSELERWLPPGRRVSLGPCYPFTLSPDFLKYPVGPCSSASSLPILI